MLNKKTETLFRRLTNAHDRAVRNAERAGLAKPASATRRACYERAERAETLFYLTVDALKAEMGTNQ